VQVKKRLLDEGKACLGTNAEGLTMEGLPTPCAIADLGTPINQSFYSVENDSRQLRQPPNWVISTAPTNPSCSQIKPVT